MKKYSIKFAKYISCILILISVINCADDDLFRETNTNPESFVNITPITQITGVQLALSGGWYEQWRANLIYGEGFIQHLGGSWSTATYGSFYTTNGDYQEALWTSNYGGGVVRNLVDVLERTKGKPEYNNTNAIAKVLKVMVFQRLTDLYGDVPYSEAGLGYHQNIYYPKYDNQKDIYTDFFKLLDDAYSQFTTDSKESLKGDNFYEGDILKWKKLINALRLRCAMRISKVDQTLAQQEIQKAVTNGLFVSNDDNCYAKHDNTLPETEGAIYNGNGLSQALKGAGEVLDHPTTILLDKLNNDPRKKIWFLPNSTGVYEGINPNNYRWDHPGGSSRLSQLQTYLYENNAPYIHITYSETLLLLAEASFRGLYNGNAQDLYKKGIEAGITQWSIFGPKVIINNNEVTTFIASKNLTLGKELEDIATQQWLTLFLNGMEAYSNYRRCDLPTLITITNVNSGTNGIIPKRMPYPIGESTTNKNNFLEASAKYNNNSWLSKIWWDIQ